MTKLDIDRPVKPKAKGKDQTHTTDTYPGKKGHLSPLFNFLFCFLFKKQQIK